MVSYVTIVVGSSAVAVAKTISVFPTATLETKDLTIDCATASVAVACTKVGETNVDGGVFTVTLAYVPGMFRLALTGFCHGASFGFSGPAEANAKPARSSTKSPLNV